MTFFFETVPSVYSKLRGDYGVPRFFCQTFFCALTIKCIQYSQYPHTH